ncbi:carboxylate--amine ligase [Streptomyces lomondensis]|uniref:ATP-grasp domain-containing protein n=1 Tax=Streptomyces lomondensis TaxID=68229 RepID=A0ABQ2WW86_9ACTN|nr:ATP-grasp domain-containing protein [Streptomyces lomondensis]MCF0078687.1 ATP-grasp domain-containing protein [Streptomyces lomondensis]GGW79320.1 ATP-grasp domain-containing protein [Streptomyces lomondensis]
MSLLDTRVPAVLLRIDRNPFHHGTLGAVRSLGRAGVEVHVVADAAGSPVHRSRYVREMHPPPLPGASPDEILGVLRRVADRVARPAVLVPMDDASAIAVGRMRDDLAPSYLLPTSPCTLPERVADKAELAALCASAGVPHPLTLVPDSPARVADAARQLGLPLVGKWSRPWLVPAGSGLRSTVLVRSVQQARELYLRTDEAGSRLLLQAYLPPGPDRDWFFHGYADHSGTVRAGGQGRKQLARPRGAGSTAVGCWTPNAQVHALAERLIGVLGYRGIFDLDFRRCGTTGRYHLLDFNPRPGAQFRLFANSAGLDVVRALHLDLTGRPLPDGVPVVGRAFVVENYAPLAALRAAPGGRELAWYARDDRVPGWAMWALWCRHVSRRLRERLGATATAPAPRLIPRAASASPSLTDNEKASM